MLEKDSLESLKIDTSMLNPRKPPYIKNVKVNIYLDAKERERAKTNGGQIPVKVDVDKIRHQILDNSPTSTKSTYYLKVDDKIESRKNQVPRHKTPGVASRISNINEHQMDYTPKSPVGNPSCVRRRVPEPLSPISILSRDGTFTKDGPDLIEGSRGDADGESIEAVGRANQVPEETKSQSGAESNKLLRHGTYIVENCGDRVFLLPVIYNKSYTKKKILMNLNEVYNIGDFWTFWTSRDRMNGAPLLEQQMNLQQQIQAFDKLLHHAMNKFSDKKMHQMLTAACQRFPDLQDNLPSMGTLRMIYNRLETNKMNRLQTEEELPLMKYLETFFDDLEYLKDLKKYFDQRIYTCLYEYFFDPEIDLDGISFVDDAKLDENEDEILTYRSTMDLDFRNMTDKQKLGYAIKDMYYMNKKWDLLYKDEELKPEVFDPDSYHEMVQFPRFLDFENVFRVVPDIFTKAYKSIEIAKIWWSKATEVYESLPGINGRKVYTSRELRKKLQDLEDKIARLTKEINIEEELLQLTKTDLEGIKIRELRCDELQENCEVMEEQRFKREAKYDTMMEEKEAVQQEIEESEDTRESTRWRDLENVLKTLDKQLAQVHNELKLLSFQYELKNQDLQVELQMRPEFLRYIGTLEIRIGELEKSLKGKRVERHDAKKRFALIRTNCEKIREIMEKYIDSSRPQSESGEHKKDQINQQSGRDSKKDNKNKKTETIKVGIEKENPIISNRNTALTSTDTSDTPRRNGVSNKGYNLPKASHGSQRTAQWQKK